MSLISDLNQLRSEPGTDPKTIRRVFEVLESHAGRRETIMAGSARVKRLQQANALLQPGMKRPRAIRVIAGAIGVSEASARRYYGELRKVAEATAAHHVSQKGGA